MYELIRLFIEGFLTKLTKKNKNTAKILKKMHSFVYPINSHKCKKT